MLLLSSSRVELEFFGAIQNLLAKARRYTPTDAQITSSFRRKNRRLLIERTSHQVTLSSSKIFTQMMLLGLWFIRDEGFGSSSRMNSVFLKLPFLSYNFYVTF